MIKECKIHGLTEHYTEKHNKYNDRYRCKKCNSEYVTKRRIKVKEILIEENGKCCQICGYDKCRQALQFHHVKPEEKKFGISFKGMSKSLKSLREEASKCILLCANCHAEVEANVTNLPVNR